MANKVRRFQLRHDRSFGWDFCRFGEQLRVAYDGFMTNLGKHAALPLGCRDLGGT